MRISKKLNPAAQAAPIDAAQRVRGTVGR